MRHARAKAARRREPEALSELETPAKSRVRPRKKSRRDSSPRPYGGRAPEERKQDRRERLLEAGLDLFGSMGYAQTSIERLCARAGVTTRHFYEEFGSRQALLKAVFDRVVARSMNAVREALVHPVQSPRDLLVGLEAFLHSFLDDPRYGRIASIETVGISPELERHRRSVIHAFAEIILQQYQRSVHAGFSSDRPFRLTAIALTGAVNELCIEALMQPGRPDIAQVKAELARLFIALFRP